MSRKIRLALTIRDRHRGETYKPDDLVALLSSPFEFDGQLFEVLDPRIVKEGKAIHFEIDAECPLRVEGNDG